MTSVSSQKLSQTNSPQRQTGLFFLPHLNGTDGGPKNDGMPAVCILKKVLKGDVGGGQFISTCPSHNINETNIHGRSHFVHISRSEVQLFSTFLTLGAIEVGCDII